MVYFDPSNNCVEAFDVSGHVDVFIDGELHSSNIFTSSIKVRLVLSKDAEFSKDSSLIADPGNCETEENSLSFPINDVSLTARKRGQIGSVNAVSNRPASKIFSTDEGSSSQSIHRTGGKRKAPIVFEEDSDDTDVELQPSITVGDSNEPLQIGIPAKKGHGQVRVRKPKNTVKRTRSSPKSKKPQQGQPTSSSAVKAGDSASTTSTSIKPLKKERQDDYEDLSIADLVEDDIPGGSEISESGFGLPEEPSERLISGVSAHEDEQEREDVNFIKAIKMEDVSETTRPNRGSGSRIRAQKQKRVSETIKGTKDCKVAAKRSRKSTPAKSTLDKFTCEFCGNTFLNSRAKKEHFFTPNSELKCHKCNTVHFSQGSLFSHYCSMHPELQDFREQFGDGFSELNLKVFKDENNCPLCLKSVSDGSCIQHFDSVHFIGKLYSCCVCREKFNTESAWLEHCITNHSDQGAAYIANMSQRKKAKGTSTKPKGAKTEKNAADELHPEKVQSEAEDNGEIRGSGTPSYHCKHCKKTFRNNNELVAHRKKKRAVMVTCQHCGLGLPEQAHLIAHELRAHGIGNSSEVSEDPEYMVCPVCPVKIKKRYLVEHLRTHTNDLTYICCICGQMFKTKQAVNKHCEKVHEEKKKTKQIFHCNVCNLKCESASEFNSHKATHWTVCRFCNEKFAFRSQLQTHYEEKHPEQMFQCDHCDRKFPSKIMLHNHHRDIQFRSLRPCPKCGLMLHNLRPHMKSAHPEFEERAQCSICGATLKNERCLKEHMRRSHKSTPQVCIICSKTFKNSGGLRKHLTSIHFITKVYECQICGKKCSQSYNLKVHMRVHSLTKLFSCPVCNQGFNYKASLRSHLRSNHPYYDYETYLQQNLPATKTE